MYALISSTAVVGTDRKVRNKQSVFWSSESRYLTPPAPPYPLQDFKALYKCCIIIIIIQHTTTTQNFQSASGNICILTVIILVSYLNTLTEVHI